MLSNKKTIFALATNLFLVTALSLSSFSCSKTSLLSSSNTKNTAKASNNTQVKIKTASVINNQVVIKFSSQVPAKEQLVVFGNKYKGKIIKIYTRLNIVILQYASNIDISERIQVLGKDSTVQYAEPNYKYSVEYTVNDPKSSEQNGLALANLAKAWDITMGDPKIIIAVIDTGADLKHPDLKNKLVAGYNVLTQGATSPQDDNGHGTHASGIAGADTDNKIGVAGAAPRCKLMPVKVLDAHGSGGPADVALGIVWAVDHGAKVLNLSLGGPHTKTFEKATEYALMKNVVVVSAMGNDGQRLQAYPAAYKGVISVGSVDIDSQKSDFSNFGNWISVVAPGRHIMSTMTSGDSTMTTLEGMQNNYEYLDGTSMACPMVAGIVGLMLSRNPNLTPAEVKAKLESTATDLGTRGYDEEYGFGLVNARKAVL